MFKLNLREGRGGLLIWIVMILGTALQLGFLFSHNFHGLLLNTLPDDAFYYFNIARNIVSGHGSTFDMVNITNGYHPLWMVILLPIFKVFSVGGTFDIAPIYAALSLSILLSTLTGTILWRIFRKFTNNTYIISFGLFLWFFNPYNIYAVLNGLETSLMLFLLALFSLLLLQTETHRRKVLYVVTLGVVGGLLILARLDSIFVVFSGYLFILYKIWTKGNLFKKADFTRFFTSGIITLIIYMGWQLWNYRVYGMTLTSASITGTYVNHMLTYYDNGGKNLFLVVKTMVYMFDRAFTQLAANTGAPFVIFPMLGIAMYFLARNLGSFWESVKMRNLSPLWFISAGLVLQMIVSATIRWSFRDWYFIPTLFIFQFIVVYACIQLMKEFKYFKYTLGIIVLLCGAFFYISYDKNLQNREIMQETMWQAVQWQNENLREGSKIGSFNAGIQGYFSKHSLVNLDGLVNNTASEYMLRHDIWSYISNVEKLDYISDFPQYFTYRYSHFFGEGLTGQDIIKKMKIIHTIEANGNIINVYQK